MKCCPNCQARVVGIESQVCRRCSADLSCLFAIEHQANYHLKMAICYFLQGSVENMQLSFKRANVLRHSHLLDTLQQFFNQVYTFPS